MKRTPGRPKGTGKAPGQKYVKKSFSCPPDLWEAVEGHIPERERSPLIQAALRQALDAPERFEHWRNQRDALYLRGGVVERYARAFAERWENFHVDADFLSLTPDERRELMSFQDLCSVLWWDAATAELMDQARPIAPDA